MKITVPTKRVEDHVGRPWEKFVQHRAGAVVLDCLGDVPVATEQTADAMRPLPVQIAGGGAALRSTAVLAAMPFANYPQARSLHCGLCR